MQKKSSFALVIPCYNEENAIAHFSAELTRLFEIFKNLLPQTELYVVIVDNNSTDPSRLLLNNLWGTHLAVRIIDCRIQGYGSALKCGFAAHRADYYAFADLDNTYPILELAPMLALLQSADGRLDMLSAGRLNGSSQIPWVRKVGNIFYSWLTKLIFKCPIKDTCSGMRIFRHERKSEVLALKQNDLSFSIELTAHALKNNWMLAEHQISYRERFGPSKLSVMRDGFKFLYILLSKKISHG